MTYLTTAQAATMRCPVARTFGDGKRANCDGCECILWRSAPTPASDPQFVGAVKAEQERLAIEHNAKEDVKQRDPKGFHNAAVANVAAQPWRFIRPDPDAYGYCGMGGKP